MESPTVAGGVLLAGNAVLHPAAFRRDAEAGLYGTHAGALTGERRMSR